MATLNALPELPSVHGRFDRHGRLVSAEPLLAELHARAGGRPGEVIAVPQLASIARLTFRLQIEIAQSAVAACGDQDLDLFVRSRPDGDEVEMAISGWTEHPAIEPRAPAVERDRDFMRAAAEWMWECDAQLRFTSVAPQAAAAIATVNRALLGQPISSLFRMDVDSGVESQIDIAVRRVQRFQRQYAHLNGGAGGLLELSGVPLIDGTGHFAGFHGVAAPIDVVAEALPAIVEPTVPGEVFRERLGQALRDPLDRIIASADSIRGLADGPLRQAYAEYATDIAGAGRHMLALVDDLIDLQIIERSDYRPEPEAIDLADVAVRASGLLAVRAADRHVSIELMDQDREFPATANFRRTLQILINLVGNAVRHSPPNGTVWIRGEREGDIVAIIVADAGSGIAPEHQERIFGRFERLEPVEPGGSGLGLYISRRLARAMGGDLNVDSAPGAGARFILTLPARTTG